MFVPFGHPPRLTTVEKNCNYIGFEDGGLCTLTGHLEWFEVLSGVKQGCVMSGFLFLIVIDWVKPELWTTAGMESDGN